MKKGVIIKFYRINAIKILKFSMNNKKINVKVFKKISIFNKIKISKGLIKLNMNKIIINLKMS